MVLGTVGCVAASKNALIKVSSPKSKSAIAFSRTIKLRIIKIALPGDSICFNS